jgi:putative ABC transport system substrate-binding protein
MINILKSFIILFIIVNSVFASYADDKIAVVIPMTHRSMDEIVRGIKDNHKINSDKIMIFNAMGDTNNLYAIINQIGQNSHYKAIMPIGTTATYISMNSIKEKYIVSLASIIDEETRQELIIDGHPNITNIYDAVTADKILEFISAIKKRNVLLIYSNDQRIIDEVKQLEILQDKFNIKIHKFNITHSTDIYSINSAISNIDCILLLKDHLVVSMINVITNTAHEANIPVIASDEGSIIHGADIGLGIPEYQIGFIGAEILKDVLDGKKLVDIPVRVLDQINIFYNQNSRIDINLLQSVSKSLGYNLQAINSDSH